MNVLVTHSGEGGNPYVSQLLEALEKQEGITSAIGSSEAFWDCEEHVDVLHLQWPEHLFPYGTTVTTDDLQSLHDVLGRWAKRIPIIATVHNEYPHKQDSPGYRAVYRLVYMYADGLIHLGEASKEAVNRRYSASVRNAAHAVIPHGNYECFRHEDLGQNEARRRLQCSPESFVLLAFGSIRTTDELRLLVDGFGHCSIPERELMIAGRVQWPSCRAHPIEHASLWGRTRLRPSIKVRDEYIPDDDVEAYVKAADAVVVPRIDALNSGNVALGFTFGRVVVGPDRGVIGETLRKTQNPVFEPRSPQTLGAALDEAHHLSVEDGRGEKNREYGESHMEWNSIAAQHEKMYSLVSKRKK